MAKLKTKYVCSQCGCISPKWMGKCPECSQWNTFIEEVEVKETNLASSSSLNVVKPKKMNDISLEDEIRLGTGLDELDRVLGGGIVKGSLVLVGGDPGIGKSTLLLQLADNVAKRGQKILYISGEESARQIKTRAQRMDAGSENIYLLSENNMDHILINIHNINPDLLVIDSIQTVYNPNIMSAPGSVSQVRDATGNLLRIAKGDGVTVFIVGHVTKAGAMCRPKSFRAYGRYGLVL